jgi:hypothetical protein
VASDVAMWYGMGERVSEAGRGNGSEDGRVLKIVRYKERAGQSFAAINASGASRQGTFPFISPSRNSHHDELELIAALSGYHPARLNMTCRASLNVCREFLGDEHVKGMMI